MKNLIKQKHVGITLTIVGIVLVSMNFLSYLMSNTLVFTITLPAGFLMMVTGFILIRRVKRTAKKSGDVIGPS